MKVTAEDLFNKLVHEYDIIGQRGSIEFTLKVLTVIAESRDTIGNMLQEWLKLWMRTESIEFVEIDNTQNFPDFYLDGQNTKNGLLEVKAFNNAKGPGFDIANFDSFSKSLLQQSYRLDTNYLIFGYEMIGTDITIKNVWLRKIWQLTGGSKPYPLKVQEKKKVIYNIRPVTWYSKKSQFPPFNSLEDFLIALNETRYAYAITRHENSRWLKQVIENYKLHTGIELKLSATGL
jgi:type II restriction enzyme